MRRWALFTAVTLFSSATRADAIAVINDLRARGCGGQVGIAASVRPHSALNEAARALALGDELKQALDGVADAIGYEAASSASFHVRGSREDAVVRRLLAERSCASINDPRYEEIGFFTRGDDTWIVLAVRRPPEPVLDAAGVTQRVLTLINAARAQRRRCGGDTFDAATPLTLSAVLNDAASVHARDMARRGSASHRGSDGSQSGERITRAGYAWRASGENVAAGQPDADAVVAAWLGSPGHCATLMAPYFTETGIAFALAPDQDPGIYWAQVFAAPAH